MHKKSEIIPNGYYYSLPRELEIKLKSNVLYDKNIRVIHVVGTNSAEAKIVDIKTDKGTIRVGYYHDNAFSILDDCTGINTVEEWAILCDYDSEIPSLLRDIGILEEE